MALVKPSLRALRSSRLLAACFRRLIACVLVSALAIEPTAFASPPPTALANSSGASSFSPEELLAQALLYFLKPRMESALPIQLNPSTALPTVPNGQLPGGQFHGQSIPLTAQAVSKPLAPGDYEIPVMAYCTQYSVHRPGRGAPAVIAPLTGSQAKTVGDLLWRGTQAGRSPGELQTAAWAIQAGVPYSQMSKQSQQDIDTFAPGARASLEPGFSIDAPIRNLYNNILANPRQYIIEYKHAKNIKFPPDFLIPNIRITAPSLDQLIAQAGPVGRAYVQAEADQQAVRKQLADQQHQQDDLLLHQAPVDPPMPAGQGPWTARVPGRVYMRVIVQGGNMQADNVLQIRVLPGPEQANNRDGRPRLIRASYEASQPAAGAPSVLALMGAPSNLLSPSYAPGPVRELPGPVRDPIGPVRDPIPPPVEPIVPPGEAAPILEEAAPIIGRGLGFIELLNPYFDIIVFSLVAAQALIIALPRLERDIRILRGSNTTVTSIADNKNKDDNNHRGRIQAQGDGVEEAEPWNQSTPPTVSDGLEMLKRLKTKLSPAQQRARQQYFEEAALWIQRVGSKGGVTVSSVPIEQNFPRKYLHTRNGEVRIDIEVKKGTAFVADTIH